MPKEKLFISEPTPESETSNVSFKLYLNRELREDISVFPKEVQDVVLKKSNGEKLSKEEYNEYFPAVNQWFKENMAFLSQTGQPDRKF